MLDTSAYSHMRTGHPDVLDTVASCAIVIVPAVVLGELEAGFRLGRHAQENRHALAEFLDEPFVSILDVTSLTAQHYGRIFAELRNAGTPIPLNDVWIAATTMECSGHLLTFDADFRRVPGISASVLLTVG